jgi:hypothetical protein
MTKHEIDQERKLLTRKFRNEYKRETGYVRTTEEVTRKERARKYFTVVVGEGPRHILRRPR